MCVFARGQGEEGGEKNPDGRGDGEVLIYGAGKRKKIHF
jgi:hypothetical protein